LLLCGPPILIVFLLNTAFLLRHGRNGMRETN
jgi:hypothetical protein